MKGLFNKLKENKQMLFTLCGMLVLIILITGTTYAVFNYSNDNAGNNDINSGHISMTYTEPSNEYVVENALPMKDAEGMNSSNYFEFSVTTKVPTNDDDDNGASIPYEITITETEGNTLTNDKIKIYVTEVEGEKELDHTLPTLVSYFEPSLYKDGQIKVGFNLHLHRNGNETITTKYRLRAWVDYDTDVSDWDTAGEFVYKFRVNVNGEAQYQGYETDQSCFAYEKNVNGNYSITGYDFSKCGGKNIVIPETIIVNSDIILLENINWVSDEEYIEANKNYAYEQGMCSADMSWDDCLTSLNATEADLLAEYAEIKSDFEDYNQLVGMEKSVLEDDGDLEPLNMFVDMGICILEWSEAEEITVKVDTIKSFNNTRVAAVSNKNDVYSVNNLNNITGKYKTSLSTMADTTPIINGLIIPEDIIIENDAFKNVKVKKIIDRTGNFPISCFDFYSALPTSTWANINKYKCKGISNVILPSRYEDKTVVAVGVSAFNTKGITSVVFSNTITLIGRYAFYDNYLINLEIPNTIKQIDNGAFASNDLISLIVPNSVESIGADAFGNNPIKSVIIPDDVKFSIKFDVYTDTNRLDSSNSPAFWGNEIEEIRNEEGEYPKSCFSYAELNNEITIDGFYCGGVKYVDIPSEIDEKPVTTIGDYAFGRYYLTEVYIPDSVTTIGYNAFGKNQLTSVNIPNSVTYLSGFNNNQLTSVNIPNSVTEIGNSAFYDNQLTKVAIPSGVMSIGRSAFSNNKKLRRIVNLPGLKFRWRDILFVDYTMSDTPFITGTVTTEWGNVEIVAE